MNFQAPQQPLREKVGVIVIHGVGQTDVGWTSESLIPPWENWSAFDRVAGLARMNTSLGSPKEKGQLLLAGKTKDGVCLAVSLEHNDDFEAFCRAVGDDVLAQRLAYSTPQLRLEYRDDLLDELNAKLLEHDAAYWVARLQYFNVPTTSAFAPRCEVNSVRDPESNKSYKTWKSFTRRWLWPDREVIVTEMFWADLSPSGGILLSRLFLMVQLFLEAPFFLGRAFLGEDTKLFDRIVRALVLSSNWIMRWPLAGINAAVFPACFVAMILHQFKAFELLPIAVTVTLVAIGGLGLWATLTLQHRRPGVADIGLAAFVASVVLAIAVVAGWILVAPETMQDPTTYISIAIRLILLFWFLWGVFNIAAILTVVAVGIKRVLWRTAGKLAAVTKRGPGLATGDGQSYGRNGPLPLARPGAAIGLGVTIGVIWKLVLAVLGILVISNLGLLTDTAYDKCGAELSLLEIVGSAADKCQLSFAYQHLINVRDLNIVAASVIGLTYYLVLRWRRARMMTYPSAALDGTLELPRLIAHPVIVTVLFAVAFINAALFYGLPYFLGAEVPLHFKEFIFGGGNDASLPPAVGLVVFVCALIFGAEYSQSAIHIGRDLVDHQYDRDPKSGPVRLQYVLSRLVSRLSGGKYAAERPDEKNYFGRRRRIQKRLQALMGEFVANDDVDRLVFFAHSQGTVILNDYLNGHDEAVDRFHDTSLLANKRVDVLTIGSPISHIYEYYYNGYGVLAEHPTLVVDSWTNMFRVDDPIGHWVDPKGSASFCIRDGRHVRNIGIPPGGHTDYWKEPLVCAKLWEIIQNKAPQTIPEILGIDRMPTRQPAKVPGLAAAEAVRNLQHVD